MWNFILKRLLGALGPLLLLIIRAMNDPVLLDAATTLALDEVTKLDGDTSIDASEKHRLAAAAVKARLLADGKVIGGQLLNLAIELALAAVRTGALAAL